MGSPSPPKLPSCEPPPSFGAKKSEPRALWCMGMA
jgi:hypothetical protein